jgi:molybdopterin-guanine dinucleotide biosynthesis protein A
MTKKTEQISAVILAGGEAKRIGGNDKGLLPLLGKPLIAWVLERIQPQADEIMISANRNLAQYQSFGYPVLTDEVTGFAGPLAGLARALGEASHPLVLCVPCDTPLLPHDLAARLKQAMLEQDVQIAVAATAQHSHNTVCLCRRDLLPGLLDYLAQGGRRVGEWQSTLKRVQVMFDDERVFHNTNSPEDLELLTASLKI